MITSGSAPTFCTRWKAPSGMSTESPSFMRICSAPRVTSASPPTTCQCSDRLRCRWRLKRFPGWTTIRFTLWSGSSERTTKYPQGRWFSRNGSGGGKGLERSGGLIFQDLPDLGQVFLHALEEGLVALFFQIQIELFALFLHLFL